MWVRLVWQNYDNRSDKAEKSYFCINYWPKVDNSFTSGSFGEMADGFSKFHDYKQLPYSGAGYSVLYTVISGERKLFLKALNQKQGASAENLARLQREYKILEQLYGNEHIVRCIGWREDANVGPCIVMEYVDGETLTDYLKTHPSNKEKRRILNELLDAVGFIHKHQIVHNDLKPGNILITHNGHNVKLIDFGYADGDFSLDKATGGTKAFASPELVRQETTDVTSDIYSLGFIIKGLFSHRYGVIVRKCQREETKNRYQRILEVRNAIRWCDLVKWLAVLALVIGVAVWAWPRHEIKYESEAQVKVSSQLNLDSIHQVYQAVYDKYDKSLSEGLADSSLKYNEFASFYLYDFAREMRVKHFEMMPAEEDAQRVFENDYMMEYGRYCTKLREMFAHLPSFSRVVKDEAHLQELEKNYKAELDRCSENEQRLNEMYQQN